jgi:hypothetical protein
VALRVVEVGLPLVHGLKRVEKHAVHQKGGSS